MQKMKYIVFDTGLFDGIVVFPEAVSHDHMQVPGDPLSAGFIRLDPEQGWVCSGRSVSLDLDSRPEDSEIANRMLPLSD